MADPGKMSDEEAEEAANQATQDERDKWDKRTGGK